MQKQIFTFFDEKICNSEKNEYNYYVITFYDYYHGAPSTNMKLSWYSDTEDSYRILSSG